MKRLVFTGGHHTSALEVAKELKSQGYDIVWFGHRYSMWGDTSDSAEYQEVAKAEIPFYDLKAGKFYNTFNPLKLIRIPWGFLQAFYYLLGVRPAGIVSFGGYLAVPTVICGWLLGIPSITHEQTITTGWANKLISLFAGKIAITWPASAKYYPQSKVVLTGLPLRPEILKNKNRSKSRSRNLQPIIFITGGKQGSHVINETIFSVLPRLSQKYRIIHQTGASSLYLDSQKASQLKHPNYSAFDYSAQKYVDAFSKADLIISRAGAHVIYDLAVLGKRCVLIPIPWVSHDEQTQNATILVNNHQGILLPQINLSADSLEAVIPIALELKPLPLDLPVDGLQRLVNLIVETF